MLQEDHACGFQPVIDVRIVDDLAGEKDSPVGKLPACLVGVLHGALHAVAEAELPSQPDGYVAGRERVVARLEQVDEPAVVGCGQLLLDVSLETEALPEVGGIADGAHSGVCHS